MNMTKPQQALCYEDRFVENFAAFFFRAIIDAGGAKSTAHKCLGIWWQAIEEARGEEAK